MSSTASRRSTPPPYTADPGPEPPRADSRLAVAVLVLAGLVAAVAILYLGRETIFFYDDWGFVFERRDVSLDSLLTPHNGHLVFVPTLIYKALFATAGLESYWPYRVTALVLHLACVGLLFQIARPRLGAWPAAALGVVVLFMGAAWEVLLWPINLVYLVPLVAGLAAWLLLERPGRGRDVAASVLVATGLLSFALGVPVALGILTRLLLDPSERRRVWVAAVPLGLFAIWYLTFGQDNPSPQTSFSLSNLPDVPGYMLDMAVAAGAGLTGLGEPFRQIALVLLGTAVLARLIRSGLSPRLTAVLVMLFAFWGLTALSRADIGYPASSRYIYPSVVFILLVVCELPPATGRGWADTLRRPAALAVLATATCVAVVGNFDDLQRGGRFLRSAADNTIPALAALEVGGGEIDPAHRPQPRYAPQVSAGQYLGAVRDLGSALPGGLAAQLRDQSQATTIDTRLWVAEEVAVRPAPGGDPTGGRAPEVVLSIMGRARSRGACVDFAPIRTPSALDVRLPPGRGLVVSNPSRGRAGVRLRRFSQSFSTGPALGSLPPRSRRSLSVPDDGNSVPWVARIFAPGPVRVCSA